MEPQFFSDLLLFPTLLEEDNNTLYEDFNFYSNSDPFKKEDDKMSYFNYTNTPSTIPSSNNNSGMQQQVPPASSSSSSMVPIHHQQQQQQQHHHQTPAQQLKRKMTLDLNTAKRPRFPNNPLNEAVLSSPDVQKLQLPTPELEKFIMSTTNPNVLQTPTSVFFPKNVTEEQELYAKGFENALKQLHDQSNTTSSSFNDHDDTSSSSYTTSNTSSSAATNKYQSQHHHLDFSNIVVKEEPQTVPDDSSTADDSDTNPGSGSNNNISPIDMESQEKIKLERKRQRNRLAASKCRKKKLERIAKLEDKVKQLKGENNELGNVLVKLRESVQLLKSQVMEHVQAGCPIVLNLGGGGGGGSSGNNFS